MPLNDDELERYARHLVLREIGGQGQARIRAAKVLVIGAGGQPGGALSGGRRGRHAGAGR